MLNLASSRYEDEIHVLHVDDEPDHLAISKRMIGKIDNKITIETTTDIEQVYRSLDTVDCILSDYKMPQMTGIELAKKIREKSDVPFILYTAQGSEEVAEAAFDVGIDDYIRKEFELAHYQVVARRIRIAVERDRSQRKLQERERELSTLVENSPDAIFRIRMGQGITRFNPAFLRIFALTPQDVETLGTHIPEFIHLDTPKVAQATRALGSLEKKNLTDTFRVHNKRGEELLLEMSLSSIIEDGEFAGMDVIARDVTEKMREEERARYEMLFKVAVDPVAIVDMEGVFLDLSDRVEDITGYRKEEMLGNRFLEMDILTEESKRVVAENLVKRLSGVDIPPYEVEVSAKYGSRRPFEINAVKIEYRGKPAVMASFRDITERKRIEEALKESEESS